MFYQGPEVYDDPEFSKRYLAKRQKIDNPNDVLEKPVILDLLSDVKGKTILDLGYRDGLFGKELLNKGAQYYLGIDGADTMIRLAHQDLTGLRVEQIVRTIFPCDLLPVCE